MHPSHTRGGRDKFEDKTHAWMPSTLTAWRFAMESVDRRGAAKLSADLWGYWIPEPSLLIGPQTEERIERYLMNWLRVREAWLYLLALPDTPATRAAPQWWRDYLQGYTNDSTPEGNSRRALRIAKVKEIFCRAFLMEDFDEDVQRPVKWFDHKLASLDHALAPLILWEAFELGFRYELLAMDRVLVPMHHEPDADARREVVLARVFPNLDLYRLTSLPSSPAGLCAKVPQARVRSIEGLRSVVLRWPFCPQDIVTTPPLTSASNDAAIETMERAVASFYVQTFFSLSGRAPLVPHAFPA